MQKLNRETGREYIVFRIASIKVVNGPHTITTIGRSAARGGALARLVCRTI